MQVKLVQGPEGSTNACFGLFDAATGAELVPDVFIQSDWCYPSLAHDLGWDKSTVPVARYRDGFDWTAGKDVGGVSVCPQCRKPLYPMEVEDGRCPDCDVMVTSPASCPHQSTDGTVTCRDCGTTASMFISTAWDWLDAHDGEEFEYNNDECNPLPILRSVDHV